MKLVKKKLPFCFLTPALSILLSLVMFYSKLCESSHRQQPHASWSSVLAAISCVGDLTVGLLLMRS